MIRLKHLFILLISCSILSCGNEPGDKANEDKQEVDQSSTKITAKEIEELRFADYALSDASLKKISNWNQYLELTNNVEQLRKAKFEFFSEEKSIVEGFLNEVKKTVPENLNTNAIQARLIALETSIYKLHGELIASGSNKQNQLQAIKEALISFSNLNFQMNKKFEKESQNIQKPG